MSKKIKDGAYVVNLDEYADVGTHWMALNLFDNDPIYFESCGADHFLKKSDILLEIKTCKQTYVEYKQMIQ